MDKFYGNQSDATSNDILDEIYEDKSSNNKGLSSQVVKPEHKGNKSVYSQAISDVKESGKRKNSFNNRNKFDNYDDNYRSNYRNNRGGRQNNQRNRSNYNDDRNQERVNVTGRNLIIKRRPKNNNSRSRSRSQERDQSKERERKNSNEFNDEFQNNQSHGNYPKRRHQQQYMDPNFFNQNNMQMQMMNPAYFNPRRLGPNPYMRGMGRGRFPTRFVKSRYLGDPTRYLIYIS